MCDQICWMVTSAIFSFCSTHKPSFCIPSFLCYTWVCSLKSIHCFIFLLELIFKLLGTHWRVRQVQIPSHRNWWDHVAGGKEWKGCFQWQFSAAAVPGCTHFVIQSKPIYGVWPLVYICMDSKLVLLWLILIFLWSFQFIILCIYRNGDLAQHSGRGERKSGQYSFSALYFFPQSC